MKTLYLIRGVSGSGKSTLAREMSSKLGLEYHEADHWFERDGVYTFNAAELPTAHAACLENAMYAMRHLGGCIVANTFTRLWEMRKYIDFALDLDYKVKIITCTGQYQNTHGLTEEMVAKQVARFQSNKEIAEELHYDRAKYGRIVYVNH
jgi:cytidylate kinase